MQKPTKKTILIDLCNKINFKKQGITGLVASHRTVTHWLTRDAINNELRRRKHLVISISGELSLATTSATNIMPTETQTDFALPAKPRTKGGRPVGTTDEVKQNYELASISTKNEIAEIYALSKTKPW